MFGFVLDITVLDTNCCFEPFINFVPCTNTYLCDLILKGLIILLGWLQKRAILEMFTIGVRLVLETDALSLVIILTATLQAIKSKDSIVIVLLSTGLISFYLFESRNFVE